MAQMIEPTIDRAQLGQNKDQNMLRWELKSLGMHAYTLAHKQGMKTQLSHFPLLQCV